MNKSCFCSRVLLLIVRVVFILQLALSYPRTETIARREVVWEPPPLKAAGIVFLFHGCQHSAGDFWEAGPGCPNCLGLPEERAIVASAHENSYVAVAISSWDRLHSRCWRLQDVQPSLVVVDTMRKRLGLDRTPAFALGASSGGGFTGMLASRAPSGTFTAVSSQIMPVSDHFFAGGGAPSDIALELVSMPRDFMTEQYVQSNVATAISLGLKVSARHCLPLPVTPTLFSDRARTYPGDAADHASSFSRISLAASVEIAAVLEAEGFLDTRTKELLEDPRQSEWRDVLATKGSSLIRNLPMEPDASALSEIMNVAWAQHEFCATDIQKTFDFFHAATTDIAKNDETNAVAVGHALK